jgi:biotin-(acetyl-CoA carboxylase) ligase
MSRPGLGPVRRFIEIDSTNRYLADEARLGSPHGLVVVAGYQTAGRGRLGRRWDAPPGVNLLMSVLLRPGDDPAAPHAGVLAVALAAADACTAVAGVEPRLKWPNDLVVDDLKLAGILAEVIAAYATAGHATAGHATAGHATAGDATAGDATAGDTTAGDTTAGDTTAGDTTAGEMAASADGGPAVVVGLGVNVGWPPAPGSSEETEGLDPAGQEVLTQEVLGKATSLARLSDVPVDPDLLLAEVLEHLARRITDLFVPVGSETERLDLQPQAHQALIEEYRNRCVTLKRRVRVEEPSGSFTGVAVDVTGEGHLVVDTPSGRRVVLAGDVVHLHHA